MNAISAIPGNGLSKESARILKAAQDFEGFLLNSLLRSLQESFSTVPGEDRGESNRDYQWMGIDALSLTLARQGGIGIAGMICKQLDRTKVVPQQQEVTTGRVPGSTP